MHLHYTHVTKMGKRNPHVWNVYDSHDDEEMVKDMARALDAHPRFTDVRLSRDVEEAVDFREG